MAVSNFEDVMVVKEMGLVSNVFDDRVLTSLPGDIAIGQTRYSTTGSSQWRNAQPIYRGVGDLQFALGHNGNLVNTEALANEAGMLPGTVTSDSDLVGELVATQLYADSHADNPLLEAMQQVLPKLEGAFCLSLMDQTQIIGVRDPNGFRPLALGRLDDGGWVLASESPAFDVVGATFVRELDPGEMIVIDSEGVTSYRPFDEAKVDPKLCVFEFVYFARPDTTLYGQNVHQARVRMGEALAEQAPVEADLVMGVPESGIPAAEGYAKASGITFGHGLVKNRYIGRTFIAPTPALRALGVRMKLNPLRENIAGKRLVVVDDSIVRGTTTKAMVAMLREAGAVEVHLRISSPPYRWPCFYGMDTSVRSELLAANLTVDEIRAYTGADTLSFLQNDKLIEATGAVNAGFCDACLSGNYPIAIPVNLTKNVLEAGSMQDDKNSIGNSMTVEASAGSSGSLF